MSLPIHFSFPRLPPGIILIANKECRECRDWNWKLRHGIAIGEGKSLDYNLHVTLDGECIPPMEGTKLSFSMQGTKLSFRLSNSIHKRLVEKISSTIRDHLASFPNFHNKLGSNRYGYSLGLIGFWQVFEIFTFCKGVVATRCILRVFV